MVCAASLGAAVPPAAWEGAGAWPEKDSPSTQPTPASSPESSASAEPPTVEAGKALTPTMKTVLKLRKKLREMSKIEDELARGETLDPLRRKKLEGREAAEAQLAEAEQLAQEEQQERERQAREAAASNAVQAQQLCLDQVLVPGDDELAEMPAPCFEAHSGQAMESFDLPVALIPMPILMYDPQQSAFGWPAFAPLPQEGVPAAAPWGSQQEEEEPEEEEETEEKAEKEAKLSTSARRRQRRQRAAERRAQQPPELREQLQAHLSDGSSSRDCLGHIDCAALSAALEAGGDERQAALETIRGSVAPLSFDGQGCRLVQVALNHGDPEAVAELVEELRGQVRSALESPHANYVIQTVVTALPTAMSSFVVQELLGAAAEVARHRFGCRVLCRLIEHTGAKLEATGLLDEILDGAKEMCQDSFAHYVMQSVLEHLPQHHGRVVEALLSDLRSSACHRCASHVVEAAVAHCSEADRDAILSQLLGSGRDGIMSLAQNQYGSYVLRTLLQVPGRLSEIALAHIAQSTSTLETSKYGLRLLQELGLAAPSSS